MRPIHFTTSLILAAFVAAACGCKKDEPKPPTTPPPAESQVPAQPTASTDATSSQPPANGPASTAETSTAGAEATPPLKGVIPPTTEIAAKAAPDAASGAVDGPKIYQTFCQSCHGATGAGDGPAAAALDPKPASFATNSFRLDPNGNGAKGEMEDIVAVVRDGAAKYGGSPLMAPWPTLTEEQKAAVARHVKSLAKR